MSKAKSTPIRFAPLIRVSTERQDKKGESLRTQTSFAEHCVKSHGGNISTWYSGQEHATPAQERAIFNRMLEDAQKPNQPFDAVIVTHHSRWSRNNVDSKRGLEILRLAGVRLFVGMNEFDLNDFNDRFVLGIQTEIAERDAAEKKWESIHNRIHRAKRGIPTGGKWPFGRRWNDEKVAWEIIPEKQAMVIDAAKRYLAGEKIIDIAADYGINPANLHKVLTKRCGTDWEIRFKVDDLMIDETIPFKIPRLLDEKTIKAILAKAKANKTYDHGQAKRQYLLTGFLFCEHCGYALSGTPNATGLLYYRHSNARTLCNVCPRPNLSLRAESLDELVIRHLFSCFGNPKAFQEAIERAIPNRKRLDEQRVQQDRLEANLKKTLAGRARIVKMIDDDLLKQKDAESQLKESYARELALVDQIQRLRDACENAPDSESVLTFTESVAGRLREFVNPIAMAEFKGINRDFDAMTFDDKRALLKTVFSGSRVDGKPMGVYVNVVPGDEIRRRKRWEFRIFGNLSPIAGTAPWTPDEIREYFRESACVVQSAWH